MEKMTHNPFGHPANQEHEPLDLPIGLGMALAQNAAAMDQFTHLPAWEREEMIEEIQSSKTGKEAKAKIANVMGKLSGMAHCK